MHKKLGADVDELHNGALHKTCKKLETNVNLQKNNLQTQIIYKTHADSLNWHFDQRKHRRTPIKQAISSSQTLIDHKPEILDKTGGRTETPNLC